MQQTVTPISAAQRGLTILEVGRGALNEIDDSLRAAGFATRRHVDLLFFYKPTHVETLFTLIKRGFEEPIRMCIILRGDGLFEMRPVSAHPESFIGDKDAILRDATRLLA
jgi:hypothetical protein